MLRFFVKPAILVGVFTLGCAHHQSDRLAPAANSEGTTTFPWSDSAARGAEAEIYRTWMRYLSSKQGYYSANAWKSSPYWMASEQERWHVYDLAGFYLPDSARPEVLNIQAEPALEGQYRVVTAFHSDDENNSMRSRVIRMTVFAVRSGNGWVFGNALPRLTRSWHRDTVGAITYIREPGYPYDRKRAQSALAFIDSLASAFQVPRPDHLDYYLTSSEDEFYRILGLETDKKWGAVGGLAQPVDHQLFSGIPSQGENYRHELTHIVILPLIMGHATSFLVSEGIPTWLGGTTGMDFPTAARGLAEFLSLHPEVTLDTLMSRWFPVTQSYPAGAVFVAMTYEKGGTDAVRALFDAGSRPDDFRAAAEHLFKRPWSEIALDWRAHVFSFLAPASTR